ncbi:MAG TPA: carboxypeptidase-like regulatory domain-containing protein [Candidatus Cloacimonadota bacterium]|nr:carboxypeptidase-like regulatory domain-containing protein [Candidatus Cloacimonadota bacterium]
MKACLVVVISLLIFIPLIAQTDNLGFIAGSVFSDDGVALKYANISFFEGSKRVTGTQTDGEGRFKARIPAGTYEYRVSLIGYNMIDSLYVTVEAGQTTTLPLIHLINNKGIYFDHPYSLKRGWIFIEVTDVNEVNIVNAICTIYLDSVKVATCQPGITGSLIKNLLPGKYTVRVNLEGYRPVWYYDIPIEIGKTCGLNAILKPQGKHKNSKPILRKYKKSKTQDQIPEFGS